MRTNQDFKEYVYAKADSKKIVYKKKCKAFLSAAAAFSVLLAVGGVFIHQNLPKNAERLESASFNAENGRALCYSLSEDSGAGIVSDSVLFDNTVKNKTEIKYSSNGTLPIITEAKAIEIAKNYCDIEYDNVKAIFEDNSWKIVFLDENFDFVLKTVFLSSDGTFENIK